MTAFVDPSVVRAEDLLAPGEAAARPAADAAHRAHRALRVLVVEDDPLTQTVLGALLAAPEPMADGTAGEEPAPPPVSFEAVRAGTLGEAMGLLATVPLDVVLLDLDLPDSDGTRTFGRVRTAAPPGTPIVVLTTREDDALAAAALRRGAQDYLVKSAIAAPQLRRALRWAVERARLAAALEASQTRFASAFAHGVVPKAIVHQGRIQQANPALAALLGSHPAALAGRPDDALVHPDDRCDHVERLARLHAGREDAATWEARWTGAAGEVRVRVSAVALDDVRPGVRPILLEVQDVTELHALRALVDRTPAGAAAV